MLSNTLTKFILHYPEWPPGSMHFPCFNPANQTRSFKMAFSALILFTSGSRRSISVCKDIDSTEKWLKEIPRTLTGKSTQITVIDKSIICSVDVSLCSLGAKTRRNLQSTVPSAAALRETICFCLSHSNVSQYLGAGKATFVCGSWTCRRNRFDTIRQK